MENVNFERWLFENSQDFEPLGDIFKTIIPYNDYLPNFNDFIVWLLDQQKGFYHTDFYNFKKKKDDYYFDFIDGILDKINEYSNFEKVVIIKTLLIFLEDDLNILKEIAKDAQEEKETGFKHYTQEDCDEFTSKEYIFEQVILHFDLQAKKLNKNLPFLVVDKSKTIVNLDDPYPKVGWTIEENPNYIKETTTKENIKPQQITPIKLELNQSQIVYLFQQLEENGYLKLNQNPKLWNLVSKYFVDMNNKPLKNIHQIKDKLANSNTGKPKNEAETIEKIARFLDKLKD